MRKIIHVLFFFLIWSTSFSQDLYDSFNYHLSKKNYSEAIRYGEILKKEIANTPEGLKQDTAPLLHNLALSYYSIGKFSLAEFHFSKALILIEKNLGKNNLIYAVTLKHQAKNFKEYGEYKKAAEGINAALKIIEFNQGTNHPDYADALNILGTVYSAQNKYQEAISAFTKSAEIFDSVFGKDEVYASILVNLGNIYKQIGNYSEAESLIKAAIKIYRLSSKNFENDYALSLIYLQDIFLQNGNYLEAGNYLNEAFEILRVRTNENSLLYDFLSRKVAEFNTTVGNYRDAEILYKKVLENQEITYGKNHSQYLSTLGSFALLKKNQGNYEMAENIMISIIGSLTESHQTTSSLYVHTLNNLALVYQKQGLFSKAETFFSQSLDLMKKVKGDETWDYLNALENISSLYDDYKKPDIANLYITDLNRNFQKQIRKSTTYLALNELQLIETVTSQTHNFILSFLHRYSEKYARIISDSYENELLVKNLSLRNNNLIKNNIQKSGDSTLIEKYNSYLENRKYLARLESLPQEKRPTNYENLISQTETLEKELVRVSSAFSDGQNTLAVKWKDVQENLKSNEVALELVAFDYYNEKWTDSIQYSAFVVSKNLDAPKYIPLFEEQQLIKLLRKDEDTIGQGQIEENYSENRLGNLFLAPLLPVLENVKTIYLSPVGLGHQIDFSALKVNENQRLGEVYDVHILGSTAGVVNYGLSSLKDKPEIILYGDIDYDRRKGINPPDQDTTLSEKDTFAQLATRSGTTSWGYLPGTRQEIEQINSRAVDSGFNSKIINGQSATEESVKELDGKKDPFVLHLATHGFFFPDPDKELPQINQPLPLNTGLNSMSLPVYKSSEDPMMRSGLLLAGANKNWGKPLGNVKEEDGILTAREVANLDLSACELVVLSACDTGLGEIRGSEGVFGLQRAFKMAGVKNIIMSLWKVPDEQTAELFDIFYKEALAGKTISESFKIAQTEMAKIYSPYYWAAFVLLE